MNFLFGPYEKEEAEEMKKNMPEKKIYINPFFGPHDIEEIKDIIKKQQYAEKVKSNLTKYITK